MNRTWSSSQKSRRGGVLLFSLIVSSVVAVLATCLLQLSSASARRQSNALEVKRAFYVSEAGPIPHLPETGKITSFRPKAPVAREVASGGRLLVDVEFGRGHALYALAQGVWPIGSPEGSPALPNTGQLLRATRHGGFSVVAEHLNQPTSLELIGDTAYVVTLGGEVWKIACR